MGNTYNWPLLVFYLFCCFVFGLICKLIFIPGLFAVLIGVVVGVCAGCFEWFETEHGGYF